MGSKERRPPVAREGKKCRRKCEDFAPRNGATRARGERGAKKGSCPPPEREKSGGGNVKILLPETEPQGLAGSGEQREVAAGRPRGPNPAAVKNSVDHLKKHLRGDASLIGFISGLI